MKTISSEKNLPKPSVVEVEKYLNYWKTLENYTAQEEALNKLFGQLMPKNELLSDVLLKASTLNDFYSTNIFSVYSVAKHIHSLKIDERLAKGDVTLVGDIQRVSINNKEKNFYSFATKYCSHHNPKAFPIYDSYVDKILCFFNKEYKFSSFKRVELRNYETFKSVLLAFQKHFGLEKFDLKQIDCYLWLQGKELFKKS
ncbi:hypothetical protein [Ursidibacter sp. B-7004-1]